MTKPSAYGRTIDRVRGAASRNSEILVTLNRTQEALHAYVRSEANLRVHRAELTAQERTVNICRNSSQVKFEKHQTYRDNLVLKYAYYAGCMMMIFRKKAKEYEQAYFEALKKQKDAEDRRVALQKNLDDELAQNKGFKATAVAHGKAHRALDKLYDEVFSQPTPEFPEQEELRNQFDLAYARRLEAKQRFDTVRVNLRSTEEDRKMVRENLKTAALDAEEKRQALEIAREKVFEQVAGFGLAPPGYSDCCNRAEIQREWDDPPPSEEGGDPGS
ncbi:MAG: hypothetical protein M1821_003994 [Bathelium mastoideum]|nr:MAG: hypothetical protein M1821_003994 [Bathelium mastoideum]KAI9691066.1 MAG: hypothetical protein M1822_008686 [Bathelium mastoideum]